MFGRRYLMSEGKKRNLDRRTEYEVKRGMHFLNMLNGCQEHRADREGGEKENGRASESLS